MRCLHDNRTSTLYDLGSGICGHPLPALTDNWTHGAASKHTTAPTSHRIKVEVQVQAIQYVIYCHLRYCISKFSCPVAVKTIGLRTTGEMFMANFDAFSGDVKV